MISLWMPPDRVSLVSIGSIVVKSTSIAATISVSWDTDSPSAIVTAAVVSAGAASPAAVVAVPEVFPPPQPVTATIVAARTSAHNFFVLFFIMFSSSIPLYLLFPHYMFVGHLFVQQIHSN